MRHRRFGRRGRRRRFFGRRRGFGSIIATRRISGLGRLGRGWLGVLMPPAVGGGVAALATIGVRQFARPAASTSQAKLYKYAPWLGLAAGGLASLGMSMVGGKGAGMVSFGSALVASLGLWLNDVVRSGRMGEDVLAMAQGQTPAQQAQTVAGLRAIVPEYERLGTGAIVMEPQASRGYGAGPLGSYGEVIELGSLRPAAFGTPGFTV